MSRSWAIKENLRQLWACESAEEARSFFARWHGGAMRSRLDTDPTGRTVRQELADAKTREDAEAAMQERLWREPRIVIHSLRHTFATELIRRGVNPKVVSELLGHTTVQMTLQKYAHVWPQDKVGAVAKLDFGRGFGTRESLGAEATPQRLDKTGT